MRREAIVIVTAVVFLIALASCISGDKPAPSQADAVKIKPVRYSSELKFEHDASQHCGGYACMECHMDAKSKATAGYPEAALCAGCHDEALHEDEENPTCYMCHKKPIKKKIKRPVSTIYSQTKFEHSNHVKSDKDCANCHGDVAKTKKTSEIEMPGKDICEQCH
ncbi:MAG: hypothetical protein E3J72_20175 [Planctomycetota bacterium]|nr:MAG: hypothetical protein E3J72_20175 [Planctomycetota bacterium]